MADINLLRDKQLLEERSKKKKTSSSDIEFTEPSQKKDETKKKFKGGGILEFFKSLFSKKEKIELPQEPSKKKEIKESVKREEKKKEKIVPLPPTSHLEEKKPTALERLFHSNKADVPKPKKEEVAKPVKGFEPAQAISRKEFEKQPEPLKKEQTYQPHPEPSIKEEAKLTSLPPEEKLETLDVNLIPEDILVRLEPKNKIKQLIIVVGIIIILVAISYSYMLYSQSQIKGKIDKVIDDISLVEQEIVGYGDLKSEASLLRNKIDSINQVLKNHIYWSQFLTYLEQSTLPGVYYTNLAGSTNGKVTLTAKAVNLETLTNQYTIFQNADDFVEEVSIESAVAEKNETTEEAVSFSVSLTVKPDIFYKDNSSLK